MYKVSVQDVIHSSSKSNTQEWGIKGYSIRKFNPHMDKPPNFKIVNNKPRDFIGDVIKGIKDFPAPTKYETTGDILLKRKISIYKLPRVTAFAEEAKKYEKLPAPGMYHQELKKRPLGAFKLKEERLGFIDQAMYDGLATPTHY